MKKSVGSVAGTDWKLSAAAIDSVFICRLFPQFRFIFYPFWSSVFFLAVLLMLISVFIMLMELLSAMLMSVYLPVKVVRRLHTVTSYL